MEICEVEKCTGCQACLNACPVSAISMCADVRGFLRPHIDMSTCISCNKCQKVCPQSGEQVLNSVLDVYAAYSIFDEVRISSSSGGIFTMLAERCIASDGVVFGAAYDQNLCVHHVAVEKKEGLACLRGSKYVQSDIGNTYRQAKAFLEQGKNVLFSGTPCQIAGLNVFLGKEYPTLLTVDILCHGTPSPEVFSEHISSLSHNMNATILDYQFRSKPLGWKDYKSQIVILIFNKII